MPRPSVFAERNRVKKPSVGSNHFVWNHDAIAAPSSAPPEKLLVHLAADRRRARVELLRRRRIRRVARRRVRPGRDPALAGWYSSARSLWVCPNLGRREVAAVTERAGRAQVELRLASAAGVNSGSIRADAFCSGATPSVQKIPCRDRMIVRPNSS
jgi:hypothetical protein